MTLDQFRRVQTAVCVTIAVISIAVSVAAVTYAVFSFFGAAAP